MRDGSPAGDMSRRKPYILRYGDFVGLLLVIAGTVGYLWTEGALAVLSRRAGAPGGVRFGAVAAADRLLATSYVSLALAGAGIVILIVTAVLAFQRRRSREAAAG